MKVGSPGLPVGTYNAEFVGTEDQPANVDAGFGPGVRWKFKVLTGPQTGKICSRITGTMPTPKNACGRILAGLLGRALVDGEDIDLGRFVGVKVLAVVGQGQGGTRVETVVRSANLSEPIPY